MPHGNRNIIRLADLISASRGLSEEQFLLVGKLARSLERMYRYQHAKTVTPILFMVAFILPLLIWFAFNLSDHAPSREIPKEGWLVIAVSAFGLITGAIYSFYRYRGPCALEHAKIAKLIASEGEIKVAEALHFIRTYVPEFVSAGHLGVVHSLRVLYVFPENRQSA